MITVESPLYVNGVLVFRDSDDPDQFWVLPSSPHLAASPVGDSSFSLLEYRAADGSGAGFAELEIELDIPSGGALASATGRDNARLAPVLFRSGDVSLLTLQGSGDTLVQAVLGSSLAPLTPPFHTVFGLELSEQGAALLKQCIDLPTAPIGVVYQLRFLALTPALHAHVTMDYSRIYDHFSVGLGFTYYVSVRLDAEFSWLVENGYITITITQYTDQQDQLQQQQSVLDLVKARVEADFFSTGLPSDPGAGGIPGPLGSVVGNQLSNKINSSSALFTLKARLDVAKELKTFVIDYDGHTVQEQTHVVSGFVGEMVPGAPTPPVVRQITANDPFFATIDTTVSVAVDYADLPDLREAAVTLTYGTRVQTFVATAQTPGPFRFTCPLSPGQPEYQTHVEFHFDPASAAGPATLAAADSTRHDRAFTVSSADAFTVLRMRATAFNPAPDLISQLRVNVRAAAAGGGPDLVSDVLVLDDAHPQLDWYRRVALVGQDTRIFARTDWVDRLGNVHEGTESEVADGDYRAIGPISQIMTLHVAPSLDWQKVTQALVEIRHDVLGTTQTQSLTFLPATGTAEQTVTLALADPKQTSYSWRATVVHADGTSGTSDWQTSDVALLVVTDVVSSSTAVNVVWIGDVATTLAIRVDFWVTDGTGVEQQVASALLQPNALQTSVSLPTVPGTPLSYRYEVHRIDTTGDTLVQSGTSALHVLAVRNSS